MNNVSTITESGSEKVLTGQLNQLVLAWLHSKYRDAVYVPGRNFQYLLTIPRM